MQSIGFFGDSFCADTSTSSWCNILAKKIGCGSPSHYGKMGESIWGTFMKFNHRIKTNTVPDICVFCWTEPYRLYHPKYTLTANIIPDAKHDPKIYETLDNYWKYLHNYDKDEMAYSYSLQYYDQHVLSKVKKKIVQLWSFKPFETAGKDAKIQLTSGKFLDYSLYKISKEDKSPNKTVNHMSKEKNSEVATELYSLISHYLETSG